MSLRTLKEFFDSIPGISTLYAITVVMAGLIGYNWYFYSTTLGKVPEIEKQTIKNKKINKKQSRKIENLADVVRYERCKKADRKDYVYSKLDCSDFE